LTRNSKHLFDCLQATVSAHFDGVGGDQVEWALVGHLAAEERGRRLMVPCVGHHPFLEEAAVHVYYERWERLAHAADQLVRHLAQVRRLAEPQDRIAAPQPSLARGRCSVRLPVDIRKGFGARRGRT
jgi:hypothetical protein